MGKNKKNEGVPPSKKQAIGGNPNGTTAGQEHLISRDQLFAIAQHPKTTSDSSSGQSEVELPVFIPIGKAVYLI